MKIIVADKRWTISGQMSLQKWFLYKVVVAFTQGHGSGSLNGLWQACMHTVHKHMARFFYFINVVDAVTTFLVSFTAFTISVVLGIDWLT